MKWMWLLVFFLIVSSCSSLNTKPPKPNLLPSPTIMALSQTNTPFICSARAISPLNSMPGDKSILFIQYYKDNHSVCVSGDCSFITDNRLALIDGPGYWWDEDKHILTIDRQWTFDYEFPAGPSNVFGYFEVNSGIGGGIFSNLNTFKKNPYEENKPYVLDTGCSIERSDINGDFFIDCHSQQIKLTPGQKCQKVTIEKLKYRDAEIHFTVTEWYENEGYLSNSQLIDPRKEK